MKKLVLPISFWMLFLIVSALSAFVTKCNFDESTIWRGECIGSHLDKNSQNVVLSLNCPGSPKKVMTTDNVAIILAFANDPKSTFTCNMTRAGAAFGCRRVK